VNGLTPKRDRLFDVFDTGVKDEELFAFAADDELGHSFFFIKTFLDDGERCDKVLVEQ